MWDKEIPKSNTQVFLKVHQSELSPDNSLFNKFAPMALNLDCLKYLGREDAVRGHFNQTAISRRIRWVI